MNNDAKIGLVAILLLVVLLVIFWGRNTFWHHTAEPDEVSSLGLGGAGDGDDAASSRSQEGADDRGASGLTDVDDQGPGADSGIVSHAGSPMEDVADGSERPVTTLGSGEPVPPSVSIPRETPVAAYSPVRVDTTDGIVSPGTTTAPQTYVVQEGDSLSKIAERFYGKESGWKRIVTANKLDNPDRLRVGQRLVIPPEEPVPAVIGTHDTRAPSVALTGDSTSEAQSYTVQKGDRLIKIAEQFYGDGAKWRLIADANRVTDDRRLKVGQKLVIPALPVAALSQTAVPAP
ncbi:MAG: LysM peptidoglycan-binding domain-containing protein [Coriobacteriia bacterium]|nr:LysM peptidoglycan-binding domain-containing protein [Coriobacteriia bacterium]